MVERKRGSLLVPTSRRKLAPVDTAQLAHHLEAAAQRSVYKLYTVGYHSPTLNCLTASKAHPVETLRNHLLEVANWVLFWFRTQTGPSCTASVVRAGQPGETPGPVEMEDPGDNNEPLASW